MSATNQTVLNKIMWYSEDLLTQNQEVSYHFETSVLSVEDVDGAYVSKGIYFLFYPNFTKKMDCNDVKRICKKYNKKLPSVYELLLFALAQNKLKKLLSDLVEDSDFLSNIDVFTDFWSEQNYQEGSQGFKYLLLFCKEEENKVIPKVKVFDDISVLVDQKFLYEFKNGCWEKSKLSFLAGDGMSNLFISERNVVFLQKDGKFSYVGEFKNRYFDDIFVCRTGIFQYLNGKLYCLQKLDPNEEKRNDSYFGMQHWIESVCFENDGKTLNVAYANYVWRRSNEKCVSCRRTHNLRFEKDDKGIFKALP